MKSNIPTYQFVIDDSKEAGVKCISLVDDPAVQSQFIAFAEDKPKPKYFKVEGYEQVVFGIALRADYPIYRVDEITGEQYYGVFTKDVIKQIVHKFHKEMQSNKMNIMHSEKMYIDAYMFSDYIVDSDLQVEDLKAKGIADAKIGDWVTAYKIEDPEAFQMVLNGTLRGFSVEAFLDTVLVPFKNNIIDNKIKKEKMKINKSLKEKILSIFAEIEKFERILVPELAFEIEWSEVGQPVNKVVVDENGNETLQPVGQGEFTTDAGIIVVDEQSNLVEVRALPAEPEAPEVPASGTTSTSGSTEEMGAKMDSCVKDLMAQGYDEQSAYAICTASIGDQSLSVEEIAESLGCKKKKMEDGTVIDETQSAPVPTGVTETVSGNTEMAISGETPSVNTNGLNKTIAELCPAQGEYIISVCVDANGQITEAVVTSQTDLIPSQEEDEMPEMGMGKFTDKVKTLYSKVKELKLKMKDPITDPILTPEEKPIDFSKMSAYEKMMYKKGVKPV